MKLLELAALVLLVACVALANQPDAQSSEYDTSAESGSDDDDHVPAFSDKSPAQLQSLPSEPDKSAQRHSNRDLEANQITTENPPIDEEDPLMARPKEDPLQKLLPYITFECIGRFEGYYADLQFSCEVFHYCKKEGKRFSFICPPNSTFNQRLMICDYDKAAKSTCHEAPLHYHLNKDLYGVKKNYKFPELTTSESQAVEKVISLKTTTPASVERRADGVSDNSTAAAVDADKPATVLHGARPTTATPKRAKIRTRLHSRLSTTSPPSPNSDSTERTPLPEKKGFPRPTRRFQRPGSTNSSDLQLLESDKPAALAGRPNRRRYRPKRPRPAPSFPQPAADTAVPPVQPAPPEHVVGHVVSQPATVAAAVGESNEVRPLSQFSPKLASAAGTTDDRRSIPHTSHSPEQLFVTPKQLPTSHLMPFESPPSDHRSLTLKPISPFSSNMPLNPSEKVPPDTHDNSATVAGPFNNAISSGQGDSSSANTRQFLPVESAGQTSDVTGSNLIPSVGYSQQPSTGGDQVPFGQRHTQRVKPHRRLRKKNRIATPAPPPQPPAPTFNAVVGNVGPAFGAVRTQPQQPGSVHHLQTPPNVQHAHHQAPSQPTFPYPGQQERDQSVQSLLPDVMHFASHRQPSEDSAQRPQSPLQQQPHSALIQQLPQMEVPSRGALVHFSVDRLHQPVDARFPVGSEGSTAYTGSAFDPGRQSVATAGAAAGHSLDGQSPQRPYSLASAGAASTGGTSGADQRPPVSDGPTNVELQFAFDSPQPHTRHSPSPTPFGAPPAPAAALAFPSSYSAEQAAAYSAAYGTTGSQETHMLAAAPLFASLAGHLEGYASPPQQQQTGLTAFGHDPSRTSEQNASPGHGYLSTAGYHPAFASLNGAAASFGGTFGHSAGTGGALYGASLFGDRQAHHFRSRRRRSLSDASRIGEAGDDVNAPKPRQKRQSVFSMIPNLFSRKSTPRQTTAGGTLASFSSAASALTPTFSELPAFFTAGNAGVSAASSGSGGGSSGLRFNRQFTSENPFPQFGSGFSNLFAASSPHPAPATFTANGATGGLPARVSLRFQANSFGAGGLFGRPRSPAAPPASINFGGPSTFTAVSLSQVPAPGGPAPVLGPLTSMSSNPFFAQATFEKSNTPSAAAGSAGGGPVGAGQSSADGGHSKKPATSGVLGTGSGEEVLPMPPANQLPVNARLKTSASALSSTAPRVPTGIPPHALQQSAEVVEEDDDKTAISYIPMQGGRITVTLDSLEEAARATPPDRASPLPVTLTTPQPLAFPPKQLRAANPKQVLVQMKNSFRPHAADSTPGHLTHPNDYITEVLPPEVKRVPSTSNAVHDKSRANPFAPHSVSGVTGSGGTSVSSTVGTPPVGRSGSAGAQGGDKFAKSNRQPARKSYPERGFGVVAPQPHYLIPHTQFSASGGGGGLFSGNAHFTAANGDPTGYFSGTGPTLVRDGPSHATSPPAAASTSGDSENVRRPVAGAPASDTAFGRPPTQRPIPAVRQPPRMPPHLVPHTDQHRRQHQHQQSQTRNEGEDRAPQKHRKRTKSRKRRPRPPAWSTTASQPTAGDSGERSKALYRRPAPTESPQSALGSDGLVSPATPLSSTSANSDINRSPKPPNVAADAAAAAAAVWLGDGSGRNATTPQRKRVWYGTSPAPPVRYETQFPIKFNYITRAPGDQRHSVASLAAISVRLAGTTPSPSRSASKRVYHNLVTPPSPPSHASTAAAAGAAFGRLNSNAAALAAHYERAGVTSAPPLYRRNLNPPRVMATNVPLEMTAYARYTTTPLPPSTFAAAAAAAGSGSNRGGAKTDEAAKSSAQNSLWPTKRPSSWTTPPVTATATTAAGTVTTGSPASPTATAAVAGSPSKSRGSLLIDWPAIADEFADFTPSPAANTVAVTDAADSTTSSPLPEFESRRHQPARQAADPGSTTTASPATAAAATTSPTDGGAVTITPDDLFDFFTFPTTDGGEDDNAPATGPSWRPTSGSQPAAATATTSASPAPVFLSTSGHTTSDTGRRDDIIVIETPRRGEQRDNMTASASTARVSTLRPVLKVFSNRAGGTSWYKFRSIMSSTTPRPPLKMLNAVPVHDGYEKGFPFEFFTDISLLSKTTARPAAAVDASTEFPQPVYRPHQAPSASAGGTNSDEASSLLSKTNSRSEQKSHLRSDSAGHRENSQKVRPR